MRAPGAPDPPAVEAGPGRPVVVVGAGPVGLTAAALLAARDVPVVVLERHEAGYPLPRAVHLDGGTVRILQSLGLADGFARISRPMPGLRLVDAQQRVLVEFRRGIGDGGSAGMTTVGPEGHPAANMFHQPDLERLLIDHLAERPGVELRRQSTVTGLSGRGPVTVAFTDAAGPQSIEASAVLGADGADSTVRRLLGGRLRDLRFSERWLVIDLEVATPLDAWPGVHQVCDPRRPATFMHVTGQRYRWEFRLDASEDAGLFADRAVLLDLLAPWVPAAARDAVRIVRCTPYTFRARVAERWRDGRVVLLGDAAHQMPPFIGQGLGAGLRDAAALAWRLEAVLNGSAVASPADQLLDDYVAERRAHAVATVRGAVAVGWALPGRQDRAARLRRILLTSLFRLPRLPQLVAHADVPRLPRSRAVDRPRLSLRSLAGRPLPQPQVEANGRVQPLDALLGTGWCLLTSGSSKRGLHRDPRVRVLDVSTVRTTSGVDLRRFVRRAGHGAVLVRPDRIVAATGRRARQGRVPLT